MGSVVGNGGYWVATHTDLARALLFHKFLNILLILVWIYCIFCKFCYALIFGFSDKEHPFFSALLDADDYNVHI